MKASQSSAGRLDSGVQANSCLGAGIHPLSKPLTGDSARICHGSFHMEIPQCRVPPKDTVYFVRYIKKTSGIRGISDIRMNSEPFLFSLFRIHRDLLPYLDMRAVFIKSKRYFHSNHIYYTSFNTENI